MRATLSFNLETEKDDYLYAVKGFEFKSHLDEIYGRCRNVLKHGATDTWKPVDFVTFIEDIKSIAWAGDE